MSARAAGLRRLPHSEPGAQARSPPSDSAAAARSSRFRRVLSSRRDSPMKLSSCSGNCCLRLVARDARRPRHAVEVGRQVDVVAHLQLGVVARMEDALRCRRATAPRRRRAPGRRHGCGWCRRRPRARSTGVPLAQPLARRAAFAVGRVDAGNAQDAHRHARMRPSQRTARSASTRRCARGVCGPHGARLVDPRAAAVAVDAAGRAVDQAPPAASAAAARAPAPWCARRATMRAPSRAAAARGAAPASPGRPAGAAWPARRDLPTQRRHARRAQARHPLGRRRQRHQLHAAAQERAPRAGRRRRNRRSARAARRKRAGSAPRGLWIEGKIRVPFRAIPKNTHDQRSAARGGLSRSPSNPAGAISRAQADETILAAGIRQGIGLPYGCKDGACGSCKCKKLSGEVTLGPHQSKALSAEEELTGYVLTCCAHAQERRGARIAPGHRGRRLPDPQDAGARAGAARRSRTT